jgi:hypothetical protein
MNKRLMLIICSILLSALFLVGCLNIKTTIKVNKDGSGEILQTFLISDSVAAMMDSSNNTAADGTGVNDEGGEGNGATADESDSAGKDLSAPDFSAKLMDKEKLQAHAASMGEGVTFVSADPYKEKDFSGYKAKYAFKDINKLTINQNPAELMPVDSGTGSTAQELITFTFKKGTPAALTIIMPIPEKNTDKKSGNGAEMDAQTIEMMKSIYQDMKINMEVVFQGTISESNATYKTASAITLIDIDFNKILADTKSFNALAKSEANTLEEMKAIVKNVKGMKIEFQPKLNVKFK